jgi:hypothetical protein
MRAAASRAATRSQPARTVAFGPSMPMRVVDARACDLTYLCRQPSTVRYLEEYCDHTWEKFQLGCTDGNLWCGWRGARSHGITTFRPHRRHPLYAWVCTPSVARWRTIGEDLQVCHVCKHMHARARASETRSRRGLSRRRQQRSDRKQKAGQLALAADVLGPQIVQVPLTSAI